MNYRSASIKAIKHTYQGIEIFWGKCRILSHFVAIDVLNFGVEGGKRPSSLVQIQV